MEDPKTTQLVQRLKNEGYILVGSRAFFSDMPGFVPHDYDFVKFVAPNKEFNFLKHEHVDNVCINQIVRMPIQKLIEYMDRMRCPFIAGLFIVPAVATAYGINWLRDYKLLDKYCNKKQKKHAYIRAIYNMYVKNGGMYLTQEQLEQAYKLYKKYR